MAAHWRFKLTIVPAISAVFFTLYFLLLNHPVFPVREMPVTAIDRFVPFEPWALLVYASAAVFILIPPWLLHRKRDLLICCATVAGLCLSGLVIFFFWPTSLELPPLDRVGHPVFSALMALDKPRNVCPSEHAAFAVFTAICLHRLAAGLGFRILIRVGGVCRHDGEGAGEAKLTRGIT